MVLIVKEKTVEKIALEKKITTSKWRQDIFLSNLYLTT